MEPQRRILCGSFVDGSKTALAGEGADGADAGAEEGGCVVVGKGLERIAEERAHFDHGFEMAAKHSHVEEADVVSGEVETAGTGEVNERGCRGGERAVP